MFKLTSVNSLTSIMFDVGLPQFVSENTVLLLIINNKKIDPGENILMELKKSIHRQLKGLKTERGTMDQTETETVKDKVWKQ